MNEELPLVSVIVPVFNRVQFLPQLIATLKKQSYANIEFIIVDDGSTDGSFKWLGERVLDLGDKAILLRQENAGHYDARNNGLDHASGEYIAFQDSDDEWPEYHIEHLVRHLVASPEVDWIFGKLKRINHVTNQVVEESNVVDSNGNLHPFLALHGRESGKIKIFDDPKAGVRAILNRIPGSTQSALIRRSLFKSMRFDPTYRTAYDQFFAVKCLLKGFKFAFVDEMHQIYHVHEDNISLVAGGSTEKRKSSAQTHIRGYWEIFGVANTEEERKAARKKIAEQYAWVMSVAFREEGNYKQENLAMWNALKLQPFNLLYVKTFCMSLIRRISSRMK